MGYDLDQAIKQAEENPVEISKPVMPKSAGKRKPVSVYVGRERVYSGFITEEDTPRLIHDFKIGNLSISHVATLEPTSSGTFQLVTRFLYVKEKPSFSVEFSGEFKKTPDGYSGVITALHSGMPQRCLWDVVYDED